MKYTFKTFKVELEINDSAPEIRATNARELVKIARPIFDNLDANQEHMVVLAFNAANALLGFKIIASGGGSSSLIDPRLLWIAALKLGADHMAIAHNHPSDDPTPSEADIETTASILGGAQLLGIEMLDHVILATKRAFSIRRSAEVEA